MCGLVIGGAAGWGTLAVRAAAGAPVLVTDAVAFLTSPLLLAAHLAEAPRDLAAPVLVTGAMLLYAGYACALVACRGWWGRALGLIAVSTLHAVCLVAWVGLVVSAIVGGLGVSGP